MSCSRTGPRLMAWPRHTSAIRYCTLLQLILNQRILMILRTGVSVQLYQFS